MAGDAGRLSRRQFGFTLVEVLVALLIVGLALPALLMLVQTQQDNGRYLKEKTIASWIAQNHLQRQYLRRRLSGGVLQGRSSGEVEMANARWRWQLRGQATAVKGIRRLDVDVTLKGNDSFNPEAFETLVSDVGFVDE